LCACEGAGSSSGSSPDCEEDRSIRSTAFFCGREGTEEAFWVWRGDLGGRGSRERETAELAVLGVGGFLIGSAIGKLVIRLQEKRVAATLRIAVPYCVRGTGRRRQEMRGYSYSVAASIV